MFDYHIHTSLCKHAYGSMEEYIHMALKNGIEEICFTDHIPLPHKFDAGHRMDLSDIDTYLNDVEKCRQLFPEIKIFTGIEADYLEGYEEFLEGFLKQYSFDLVIMAIHFLKDWPEEFWVFNYDFPDKPIQDIYSDYFNAMKKGIETGFYQVVGHFDLIKRAGHPIMATNKTDVENIFQEILKRSMAIEINTSGLRKSINQTFPSMDIIELAVKRGVPVTLGSDAHKPDQVGFYFREILEKISSYENLYLYKIL
jgi:histidinol-phosphatase (PHP family)